MVGALMTIPHAVSEQIGWIVLYAGGPLAIWSVVSLFVCASKSKEEVRRYYIRSPVYLLLPHVVLAINQFNVPTTFEIGWVERLGGAAWYLFTMGGAQLIVAYMFVAFVFITHRVLSAIHWVTE